MLYFGWVSSSNVPGMGAKTADGGPEVDSNCADGKTVSLLWVPFAPGLERDADSVSLAGNLASVKACFVAAH